MNNLKNLYPCLNSIKDNTSVSYEVLLVAYKFSEDNLRIVSHDFPWVKIIVNNEISGFSENNNLALRHAEGEYCFVLNDDTYFNTPVIDDLVQSMKENPDVAVMSPNLYYPDGRDQFLGRPKLNARKFILSTLRIWTEENMRELYRGKKGIYDIYNISGAAFMIKREVFKKIGWFDERYFFSPEDTALSTQLKKEGYRICQNSFIHITHIASGTSSLINGATLPASFKGHLIFYSNNSKCKYWVLCLIEYPIVFAKCIIYRVLSIMNRNYYNNYTGERNTLFSMGSKMMPKSIFVKYYTQLVNNKDD